MAEYRSFKDLEIWKKSIELVKEVYRICRMLPKDEEFALSNQLRRASVSISSNIAEGQGRSGCREFSKFLSYALGSTYEVQTQLIICNELGFVSDQETAKAEALIFEISKMTNSLIKKLNETN